MWNVTEIPLSGPGMASWAWGLLKPQSIIPSSFLPVLAAVPVVVWGVRGPGEAKCAPPAHLLLSLSVRNLRPPACFPQEWTYNWVCEVPVHESWQSLKLDGACVCVCLWGGIYLISLELWQGTGHAKEHLLAGLLIIPEKRRVNGRLSVQRSVKGRIPNLPKSLANPVSPCSLILCIF